MNVPAGWPAQSPLVRVVGTVVRAEVEHSHKPADVDHVWLTLQAGLPHPISVSISTFSRRSRDAGVDPRVRLGRRREAWTALPAPVVESIPEFSYAGLEGRANVFYETVERGELEQILIADAQRSLRAEVIGTPYHRRPIVGLHQVHSRAASDAVKENLTGRDGAVRFYFDMPREAHWLFFKFSGQP
jgi:hypothetical protein